MNSLVYRHFIKYLSILTIYEIAISVKRERNNSKSNSLSMFFTILLAVIVILLTFLFNSHYCPHNYSLVGLAVKTFCGEY